MSDSSLKGSPCTVEGSVGSGVVVSPVSVGFFSVLLMVRYFP